MGGMGAMALKLDISKPYDHIEWSFFGANDEEVRVCGGMDSLENDVCYYCILFIQAKRKDGESCTT